MKPLDELDVYIDLRATGESEPEALLGASAFREDQHEVLGTFIATHLPSGF